MKTLPEYICEQHGIDYAMIAAKYKREFEAQNWVAVLDMYCQNIEQIYRYSKHDIIGQSRKRELCLIRHTAMWYVRKHYPISLNQIGRYFMRDHSTILHGCQLVEDLMTYNNYEAVQIKSYLQLFKQINGK